MGQGGTPNQRESEVYASSHPTFQLLGIANSARWIGRECLTVINGRRVYNRLIIRRAVHS